MSSKYSNLSSLPFAALIVIIVKKISWQFPIPQLSKPIDYFLIEMVLCVGFHELHYLLCSCLFKVCARIPVDAVDPSQQVSQNQFWNDIESVFSLVFCWFHKLKFVFCRVSFQIGKRLDRRPTWKRKTSRQAPKRSRPARLSLIWQCRCRI